MQAEEPTASRICSERSEVEAGSRGRTGAAFASLCSLDRWAMLALLACLDPTIEIMSVQHDSTVIPDRP